ncbi:MAG: KEOPS complex subunit Cgi121, partial [Haloferacaceae archaeon]
RDEAVARDPAVEVLLYAAGRRQIDRALEMGIAEGETPAVVVLAGGDEDAAAAAVESLLSPAETLGEYDETRVREFFDVPAAELAAVDGGLPDVVLERVALLDVRK